MFDKYIHNKKVAIVGPADYMTLLKSDHGKKIDSFDIVVRPNIGPKLISNYKNFLGEKTNILYNSLLNDVKCGGYLDKSYLKSLNCEWICTHPNSNMQGISTGNYFSPLVKEDTLKIIKDSNLKLRMIDYEFYNQISKKIQCRPTTGFSAILDLLSFKPKELYITGFSFYLSGVLQGYWGGEAGIEKKYGITEFEESEKAFLSKRHIHKNMWNYTKNILLENNICKFDPFLLKLLHMSKFSKENYSNVVKEFKID